MKIFEKDKSSYHSKVNFVDDNDVFVGYDMSQFCCEDAGWFISEEITPYRWEGMPKGSEYDLEKYVFEKSFEKEIEGGNLDCGTMVIFKLISEDNPDLYLHIYNAHNGYYSHGLEVSMEGETKKYHL